MARYSAFAQRDKKDFDVESATPLAQLKEGDKIVIVDFEIYYAKKYESQFAVIKTKDDKLYSTWSKVIIEGLQILLDEDERDSLANDPYEVEYNRKTSATSGREYENLKAVE